MIIEQLTYNDLGEKGVFQRVSETSDDLQMVNVETIKESTGYYLIPGEITLSDRSKYPALLGISSDDSGEMFEYYILTPQGWVSHKEIESKLGKARKNIFPFKYHLNIKVEGDIHSDAQY